MKVLVLSLVKHISYMSSYTNIITNMNETYDVEYNPYIPEETTDTLIFLSGVMSLKELNL